MVSNPETPAGGDGRRFFDRPVALGATAVLALGLVVVFPVGAMAGTALLAVAGARSKPFRRVFAGAVAPRWAVAFTGVSMLGAGLLILRVVIPANASDNAWLAVLLPGMWLMVMGVAALAVSVLPLRFRAPCLAGILFNVLVYGAGLTLAFALGAVFANERDLTGLEFRGPVRHAFVVLAAAWAANIGLHVWLARQERLAV